MRPARILFPTTALRLLLPVAFLLWSAAASAAPASPGVDRCVVAAKIFLEGLVDSQRKSAKVPYEAEARRKLIYPPGSSKPTTGISLGELAEGQRVRLHDFLSCGLSSQGYQKALGVIRRGDLVTETLKKVALGKRETRGQTSPASYVITIFGEPSNDKPWGWRLEGHHLALNFTAANGQLELSPVFMAADPAVMTKSTWAGFRLLDTEFARGLELLESLTPVQRQRAVLSATLPAEMRDVPTSKNPLTGYQGVPAAALNDAQRILLLRIVDEYIGNAEPGTAERLLARLQADGIDKLHFAWMGPTQRGLPVYYRVHGPSLVIEFLHAPNSSVPDGTPDINHIHTWWRVLPASAQRAQPAQPATPARPARAPATAPAKAPATAPAKSPSKAPAGGG